MTNMFYFLEDFSNLNNFRKLGVYKDKLLDEYCEKLKGNKTS
jgi:hypothetical protein